MPSIRVMIVDDDALVRQGLKQVLGSVEDFIVVGDFQISAEIIEKAIAFKPDIVLMNFNLPSESGIEVTKELKQKTPTVKVLALTIDTSQHQLSKIIKAGALGYILKDVDSNTLYEAIRTVARGDAYIQSCLLSKLLKELRQFLSEEKQVQLPENLGLTQRELEIVNYIACGESNKEIAEKLFISEKTVKNHVSNILRKMELEDRTQVAVYAYRQGLISK